MLIRRGSQEPDDPRRRLLITALAMGLFSVPAGRALAGVFGRVPEPLPGGRSIFSISGDVRVDGTSANEATVVTPGSSIETGANGRLAMAVGSDAFMVRPGSRITLAPAPGDTSAVERISVAAGGMLSVFGKRQHRIETPLAVIGIRGTGIYVAAQPDQDYICTCYGTVDLQATGDRASTETISSQHHDAPRYVLGASSPAGQRIRPAPFRDHSDEELLLLEALVGRTPPFSVSGGAYEGPRRDSYE